MIWFKEHNVKSINDWCKNTAVDHLGIEVTKINENSLEAIMPIDHRTVQPQRRLHGGVSCVLSETLASVAANLVINQEKYVAFGISIEANHLRPVMEGKQVKAVATPVHIGKTIQVWETKIFDENDRLICSSKLTLTVVKTKS